MATAIALNGCSNSTEQTEETNSTSTEAVSADTEAISANTEPSATEISNTENLIIGKVTAIDANNVTLELGTLNGMDNLAKNDREMPSDGEVPANGKSSLKEPTEMAELPTDGNAPNGETSEASEPSKDMKEMGEAPEPSEDMKEMGEMPQGEGSGASGGFTSSGETATYDLSSAVIQIDNGVGTTVGSIDDISLDAILELETDDDNIVITVTIKATKSIGDKNSDKGGNMPNGSGTETPETPEDSPKSDSGE